MSKKLFNHSPFQGITGLIILSGLFLFLGSAIAYLVNQRWEIYTKIGMGLGLLLLLMAALHRPDAIRTFLAGRPVKYASHAIVKTLAFLGILILINFLAINYAQEFDLTESGRFTLSEQTIQVLKQLDRPVEIIGFFSQGDPRRDRAEIYLDRYHHYTPHLSYEFHDPDLEPMLAKKYEVKRSGLVFVSDNRRYETTTVDEKMLTSGLIRITSDQTKTIYFITGHGEHTITNTAKTGYSTVKQALEREGYTVADLDLTATGAVPADATVLVLAGPKKKLPDAEIQQIQNWMSRGGKLMVMADPLHPAPLPELLQSYGISLNNNYVVENSKHSVVILGPEGLTARVIVPVIYHYPYHEITRNLNGMQTFFPFARSLTLTVDHKAEKETQPLVTTSDRSWAETNLQTIEPAYTKNVDPTGPFHLGAAAENHQTRARLVVWGNSRFVTNQNATGEWANLDLLVNAMNWLAEEETLSSIRTQQPTDRTMWLNPLQINITIFTTLIIIPLAVLAAAASVWWKRR